MDAYETEEPVRKLEYLVIATCQNHVPMNPGNQKQASYFFHCNSIFFFFYKTYVG